MTTIIQRILPDATRGRGIGLLMSVGTLGEMVGSIAFPVIVGAAGIAILGPASLLLLAAVASGVVLVGANATREPTAAEETLARVSRQPLFSGVPAGPARGRAAAARHDPGCGGPGHRPGGRARRPLLHHPERLVLGHEAGHRRRGAADPDAGPGRRLRRAGVADRRAEERHGQRDQRRDAARPRRPRVPRAGRRWRCAPWPLAGAVRVDADALTLHFTEAPWAG